MRSPIRLLLPAAAALALILPGAGSASAASRVAPPQSVLVPPGGTATVQARCPAGAHASSGGFASPNFSLETTETVRSASLRHGKRAWRIDAAGLSQESGPILAYAYCTRRPAPVRVRTAETTVTGNSFSSATALCRKGEQSVGGGFSSPGFMMGLGPHAIALSSVKSGRRGWRVDGVNPGFNDAGETVPAPLVAYAYCRVGGPPVITRSNATTVAGNEVKIMTNYCPRGTEAIAGGFEGHIAPTEMELGASGAIDSYRLPFGVGWLNRVISVSDRAPAQATAYAYCQRPGP